MASRRKDVRAQGREGLARAVVAGLCAASASADDAVLCLKKIRRSGPRLITLPRELTTETPSTTTNAVRRPPLRARRQAPLRPLHARAPSAPTPNPSPLARWGAVGSFLACRRIPESHNRFRIPNVLSRRASVRGGRWPMRRSSLTTALLLLVQTDAACLMSFDCTTSGGTQLITNGGITYSYCCSGKVCSSPSDDCTGSTTSLQPRLPLPPPPPAPSPPPFSPLPRGPPASSPLPPSPLPPSLHHPFLPPPSPPVQLQPSPPPCPPLQLPSSTSPPSSPPTNPPSPPSPPSL